MANVPAGPLPRARAVSGLRTVKAADVLALVTAQYGRATLLHHQFLRQQGLVTAYLSDPRSTSHPLPAGSPPPSSGPAQAARAPTETLLDPAVDTWLADHCPTWTVPALPLMAMADLLAQAATDHGGRTVAALRDVQVQRWLPLPGPTSIRVTCDGPPDRPNLTLSTWLEARNGNPALSRFAPVATGTALFTPQPPPRRFAPLPHTRPVPDPYESGACFHGPRFQYLRSSRIGSGGSSGVLDTARGGVPRGLLHHGLLDAATHVIPHTCMGRWSADIGRDCVTYPHRLASLDVHAPLPETGLLDVEARFAGFDSGTPRLPGSPRLPAVDLQLCAGERVLLAMRLVLVLVPAGGLLEVSGRLRRDYLRDRRYVPGLLLSTRDGAVTVLRRAAVARLDYFPGTVAAVYGLPPGARVRDSAPLIAVKEHVARKTETHPSRVVADGDLRTAWPADAPDTRHALEVTADGTDIRVRDRAAGPRPRTERP
ncbi:polyketide synthase dehydratase domain-containing protein [Streptomyces rimosus]|uniref:polyketide synthase dehydratase domain-containing protein n=1 Tax=Streptomyces rimosus TaxID=1927 RepID=UPI0005181604|nr:polyketide synthase dehydratase domain-containing protein [Streptomyces rimosus]